MTKQELIGLLFEAKSQPLGIVVSTNNPERLRQRLYAIRRGHDEFDNYSFIISPENPASELFIIDKGPRDAASEKS